MTLSMDKPHAKLCRTVFSDAEEAASVLEAYLPVKLARKIDWSTLEFKNSSTSLSLRNVKRIMNSRKQ